jgi:hypothetical protein
MKSRSRINCRFTVRIEAGVNDNLIECDTHVSVVTSHGSGRGPTLHFCSGASALFWSYDGSEELIPRQRLQPQLHPHVSSIAPPYESAFV